MNDDIARMPGDFTAGGPYGGGLGA